MRGARYLVCVYLNYCLGTYTVCKPHTCFDSARFLQLQGRKLPDFFFPLDEPEKEDDPTGENGERGTRATVTGTHLHTYNSSNLMDLDVWGTGGEGRVGIRVHRIGGGDGMRLWDGSIGDKRCSKHSKIP
jgi:hypothetical protein